LVRPVPNAAWPDTLPRRHNSKAVHTVPPFLPQ
jgi:hypothetical protein